MTHATPSPARVMLLSIACGLAYPATALSADRISMVGPSMGDEVVKTIAESMVAACNRRDVVGFLSHFTPDRVVKIRRSVESLFICRQLELDVHEAFLLSATDEQVIFGIRYAVRDGSASEQAFASRVTAKRVGNAWLLDTEEVLSRTPLVPHSAKINRVVANPVGGPLPCPQRPDWIPKDIGWQAGWCAGGRCGL